VVKFGSSLNENVSGLTGHWDLYDPGFMSCTNKLEFGCTFRFIFESYSKSIVVILKPIHQPLEHAHQPIHLLAHFVDLMIDARFKC